MLFFVVVPFVRHRFRRLHFKISATETMFMRCSSAEWSLKSIANNNGTRRMKEKNEMERKASVHIYKFSHVSAVQPWRIHFICTCSNT